MKTFCINCQHMISRPRIIANGWNISVRWPKRLMCHAPGRKVMGIVKPEDSCQQWKAIPVEDTV